MEAARLAAEKEEARKMRRAMKKAEKQKATEGPEEQGGKVPVGEGSNETPRPKKRAKTVESNTGPNGETEMEAAETACKS